MSNPRRSSKIVSEIFIDHLSFRLKMWPNTVTYDEANMNEDPWAPVCNREEFYISMSIITNTINYEIQKLNILELSKFVIFLR